MLLANHSCRQHVARIAGDSMPVDRNVFMWWVLPLPCLQATPALAGGRRRRHGRVPDCCAAVHLISGFSCDLRRTWTVAPIQPAVLSNPESGWANTRTRTFIFTQTFPCSLPRKMCTRTFYAQTCPRTIMGCMCSFATRPEFSAGASMSPCGTRLLASSFSANAARDKAERNERLVHRPDKHAHFCAHCPRQHRQHSSV